MLTEEHLQGIEPPAPYNPLAREIDPAYEAVHKRVDGKWLLKHKQTAGADPDAQRSSLRAKLRAKLPASPPQRCASQRHAPHALLLPAPLALLQARTRTATTSMSRRLGAADLTSNSKGKEARTLSVSEMF